MGHAEHDLPHAELAARLMIAPAPGSWIRRRRGEALGAGCFLSRNFSNISAAVGAPGRDLAGR